MDILLLGAGFANKGAEAMTRTVQAELRKRLGPVRFHVVAKGLDQPAFRPLLEETDLQVVPARPARSRALGLALRQPALLSDRLFGRGKRLRLASAVAAVDAVVDINGYAYGDPWGSRPARLACQAARDCRRRRKPYLFFPQAWGPFENEEVRQLCAAACLRAQMVSARDSVSRAHLERLPGLSPAAVSLDPDIAFSFSGAAPEVGRAILAERGLPVGGTPLVGIAPNMRVYERTPGTGADNRYVQCLADICRGVHRLGAAVVLIPHYVVPSETGAADDRTLCGWVQDAAGMPGIAAWTGYPSAPEIKSVIGQLDLLVGSRFHALVAALSSGVPTLALGWSHKYVELLRTFGLQDYVVDHDRLDAGELRRLVAEIYGRRAELGRAVAQALPAVQRQVAGLFDRAAARLSGAGRRGAA